MNASGASEMRIAAKSAHASALTPKCSYTLPVPHSWATEAAFAAQRSSPRRWSNLRRTATGSTPKVSFMNESIALQVS